MSDADLLNELTISLSSWELAGYISAALVAITVAGEVAHDFNLFKKVNWWHEKGGRAFGLALVAALVAEAVIQVTVSSISSMVTAVIEREAADAKERAAKLEKASAQLRLDLEKERQVRLPRRITPEQRRAIVECSAPQPKGIVFVWSKSFDNEAEDFAKDIRDTLLEAGFDVKQNTEAIFSWNFSGAEMLLNDLSSPPIHAAALQTCFMVQNFLFAAFKPAKPFPDGVVTIAISTRF